MHTLLMKRFGILCSLFVFFTFWVNILKKYKLYGDFSGNELNILILLLSIVILVSSFFSSAKIVQIICVGITCILTFYEDPEQGLGIVHIVLIALLSYSYGFIKNYFLPKVIICTLLIICVIFHSALTRDIDILNVIPAIFIFMCILYVVSLFLFDEINIYIRRENKLRKENEVLTEYLEDSRRYIRKVDEGCVNPAKAGLTNAELILLKTLCIYRESNIDLGIRLCKSPNTVKVQLTKIMIKIGAESRYQLIDLCKNYFIKKESNIDNVYL